MSVEPDRVEKEGRRMEKEVETATRTPFPAEGIVNRDCCNTVKFLSFRTQENLAVINLKFKQRFQTLGYFTKKMQMA